MDGLKTHKNYSPRNVSKPNVDKWPFGGTSVHKTMRMHNFETVSVVKWHLLPTVSLISPLIAQ